MRTTSWGITVSFWMFVIIDRGQVRVFKVFFSELIFYRTCVPTFIWLIKYDLIDKVNSKHSHFPSCPCLNVNYVTAIVKRRKQSDSRLRSDVSYFFSLLHEIRNRKRLHAGSSVKTYVAKRVDPASRDNKARSTSCHLYEHDLNTLKKINTST